MRLQPVYTTHWGTIGGPRSHTFHKRLPGDSRMSLCGVLTEMTDVGEAIPQGWPNPGYVNCQRCLRIMERGV